jgi:hypothetical protein
MTDKLHPNVSAQGTGETQSVVGTPGGTCYLRKGDTR